LQVTAFAARACSLRAVGLLASLSLAIAATAPSSGGVGMPNVVLLAGVVGVDHESAAIGQLRLMHGDRSIPFAVVSAQRLTGRPAPGVEILQRLGPGVPQVRVVGTPKALAPLLEAKPGSRIELRGVLDDANRYLQLLDAAAPLAKDGDPAD
jgi:hypothetical protein